MFDSDLIYLDRSIRLSQVTLYRLDSVVDSTTRAYIKLFGLFSEAATGGHVPFAGVIVAGDVSFELSLVAEVLASG